MNILSLIVAIVAIVLVLMTRKKTAALYDSYFKQYNTINELIDETNQLKQSLQKLQFTQLKETGQPVFTTDMRIHDAIKMHPGAQSVFASFHLGGCSACAVGEHETIQEGANAHNVDVEKLMDALNKLK